MTRLKKLFFLLATLGIVSACSSRGANLVDANSTTDGTTTTINTYAGATPTPSPFPTPSPTPSTNSWQSTTNNPIAYSGVPQGNSWTNFTGWPYNAGYAYNGYNNYTGYPGAYQTQYDSYFPNYHANYNAGYYVAVVTALYRGILGRDPDLASMQFWMRELIAGRPYTNIREEFLKSPEVTALGNITHVQNVIGVFRVVQGVLPERGALQYWAAQLTGGMPLSQLATNLRGNPQYALGGYSAGLYTRSVIDLYKGVLARFANPDELLRDVTSVSNGNAIVGLNDSMRASAEANSIGKLRAENCSAVHRIIRGLLPERAELARCVAMGDNTVAASGSVYNPILQQYVQQLMYGQQ